MQNLFKIIFIFLFSIGTSHAQNNNFELLYTKDKIDLYVQTPSKDKIILIDFFWYGCPHCYKMKPLIDQLEKRNLKKISRIPFPVAYPTWESGARLFFAIEELGLVKDLHEKTFAEIHLNQKNILKNPTLLENFLIQQKLNPTEFQNRMKSFSVSSKWNKAKKITEAYKIEGSPSFAIYKNGYVYQTAPTMAGDYQKTIDVLEYIINEAK